MAAWTDERIALTEKLWLDGLPASAIARRVGGVTRCAVLGKVRRMGLPFREHNGANSSRKRAGLNFIAGPKTMSRAGRAATLDAKVLGDGRYRGKGFAGFVPENAGRVAPVSMEPDLVIPVEDRKTILAKDDNGKLCANEALTDSCCRWPIGDPQRADFGFCGRAKQAVGLPYCEFHNRRAFAPAQPKHPPTEHSWGGKKDHPTPSTPFVSKEFDAMEPA